MGTKQLDALIAKFSPRIAALGQEALEKLRARLPGAVELVYDTAASLAIGFGPDARPGSRIFSLVLDPAGVGLVFLRAEELEDPKRLLRGNSHLVLENAADLEMPGVRALMTQAIKVGPSIDPNRARRTLIKAVSEAPRPGGDEAPAKPKARRRAIGRRPK